MDRVVKGSASLSANARLDVPPINRPGKYKTYTKADGTPMLLFAHRGASADWPENTKTAILKAYENGAHGYEIDIQGTQGQAIILHDSTLRRTAVKGAEWMPGVAEMEKTTQNLDRILNTPVFRLPFEDTQKINVGTTKNPESPPALSEILIYTATQGFFGLHEVKLDHQEAKAHILRGYRESLYEALAKTKMSADELCRFFCLISFDDTYLEMQKRSMPEFKLSIYWVRGFNQNPKHANEHVEYLYQPVDPARAKSIGAHFDLECCEEAIRMIPSIQAAGFSVGVWVRGENLAESFAGTDGDKYANLLKEVNCEFMTTNLPTDMKLPFLPK